MSAVPQYLSPASHRQRYQQKEPELLVAGHAFDYYARNQQPDGVNRQRDGTYPLRNFLPQDWLASLVEARGQKLLTFREIKLLVGYDGNPLSEICANCGKRFTPIAWYDASNPDLLNLIDTGWEIGEAINEIGCRLDVFGSFYPDMRAPNRYSAFCGPALSWNERLQRIELAWNSCLVKRKEAHSRESWGVSRAELDHILRIWSDEDLKTNGWH